jgi:hypothetical protein
VIPNLPGSHATPGQAPYARPADQGAVIPTWVAYLEVSTGGRWRHARAAIGWPGEVLRRVRLVFTPMQQPPIDAATEITWPRRQYVFGYRIKAPNQAPLSFRLDVPRPIDVLHCHAA